MTVPADLKEELDGPVHTLAGDPFALVVIIDDFTIGAETWHAQLKGSPSSSTIKAEFDIVAEDGAGHDYGEGDEAGNLVLVLSLTGTQTKALKGKVLVFDVEKRVPSQDPLTYLKGEIEFDRDITREEDET